MRRTKVVEKYVHLDIDLMILTIDTDQITLMQKKLNHEKISLQKKITKLKQNSSNSDHERLKVLLILKCKEEITEQQL